MRELLHILEECADGTDSRTGRYPRPALLARDLMATDYWRAELAKEPPLTAGELKGLRKLLRDFLGPVQAPKTDALAYAGVSTRRPPCLHDPHTPPELVIDSRRTSSIEPETLHIRIQDQGLL